MFKNYDLYLNETALIQQLIENPIDDSDCEFEKDGNGSELESVENSLKEGNESQHDSDDSEIGKNNRVKRKKYNIYSDASSAEDNSSDEDSFTKQYYKKKKQN